MSGSSAANFVAFFDWQRKEVVEDPRGEYVAFPCLALEFLDHSFVKPPGQANVELRALA